MSTNTIQIQINVFKPNYGNEKLNETLKHALSNFSILNLEMKSSLTIEDLLLECMKLCNITSLYVPLFAIWDMQVEKWVNLRLSLQEFVEQKDRVNNNCFLELRIRFVFASEDKMIASRYSFGDNKEIAIMDNNVTEYYFHQQRSDFLNNRLKIHSDFKMNDFLGVAAIDMLRLAKQVKNENSFKSIKDSIKLEKLLPRNCEKFKNKSNALDKWKTRRTFNHYVNTFKNEKSNSDIDRLFRVYLRNLELLCKTAKIEEFAIEDEQYKKLQISADNGIVLKGTNFYGKCSKDIEKSWCDIAEIVDLNITVEEQNGGKYYVVALSKVDGERLYLRFTTNEEAENAMSLIDGYYRLLMDPYHYLNIRTAPPSVVKQNSFNCHGPIPVEEAKALLLEKTNYCLIRLSPQNFDDVYINYKDDRRKEHELQNVLVSSIVAENMVIGKKQNAFSEIEVLLKNTSRHKSFPFSLKKLVPPQTKNKSILLIRRCKDKKKEQMTLNDKEVPHLPTILDENFKPVKLIGQGKYTQVNLYLSNKSKMVVFKELKPLTESGPNAAGMNGYIEKSFRKSLDFLAQVHHEHIIKTEGFSASKMIVLEYAIHNSIMDYLKDSTRKETGWKQWSLQVFWQIAHAFSYLESINLPHGKLHGQNILLFKAHPKPQVKLSDPGVCLRQTYYEKIRKEAVLKPPWLACEYFTTNETPNPTVNGDKWSFATTLCEISDVNSVGPVELTDDVKERYATKSVLPLKSPLTDSNELVDLITRCWDMDTSKRPLFKQILRELGYMLYVEPFVPFDFMSTGVVSSLPHSEINTSGAIIYEDDFLVYEKKLGGGHFGEVRLYTYQKGSNDFEEMVAVKEFKDKSTSDEIYKEIDAMIKIQHKYIVQLKGITLSKKIVMEYLPLGSLKSAISTDSQDDKFQFKNLVKFSMQIAEALEYLHKKEIVHKDLALRNILLEKTFRKEYNAKISDFGLSRTISNKSSYCRLEDDKFPVEWYPPEVLGNLSKYYYKSDIWSYGVTVWELFSKGLKPSLGLLTNSCQAWHRSLVKDNRRLPQPKKCTNEIYQIMMECWKCRINERPDATALVGKFKNVLDRTVTVD